MTSLIPHPRFSFTAPIVTAREIMLAALCAGLKAQVVDQATKITALEERNRQLTKALHRTACAGHVLPQVLYFGGLLTACGLVHAWLGTPGILTLGAGFLFGVACLLCALHDARPRRTTTRRRVHPAHLDEPAHDARIIHAIRRAPLGVACTDESGFGADEGVRAP